MMGTVIVSIGLLTVVAVVVLRMRKDKKNGKGSCGGDCCKCRGCH